MRIPKLPTIANMPRLPRGDWRPLPLDGKLLLFDRLTGTNVLLSGEETKHLKRTAPRMLQVSLTNACNKTCDFCYRPLDARSEWKFEEVVELARFCDDWGVMELAFGGGEPTVFPRFAELLKTIWSTTHICPNFTTNGLRLTRELLREIRGSYGQLQLSVYDEDDTNGIIDLLASENASFGLNYLVTPARVRTLEADVLAYAARGVKDMLFLSYKGTDAKLHLTRRECEMFDESVAKLHESGVFGSKISLKVDVCWATRLTKTPQLLNEPDCQANVDFLSITSNKRVLSCSFFSQGEAVPEHAGEPFDAIPEIRSIYDAMQKKRIAARSQGCARLPDFGFGSPGHASRLKLPVVSA